MSSQDELKAFFAESLIMKDFDHPNVLGLSAVCFDTPDGYPLLILPFMVNGSLKDYLKKTEFMSLMSIPIQRYCYIMEISVSLICACQ